MNALPWILAGTLAAIVIGLLLALAGAARTIEQLREAATTPVDRGDVTHPSSGLPAGTVAPAFEGTDAGGAPLRSSDLDGERRLLVFVDPDCAACDGLVPEAIAAADRRQIPPTLLVSKGDPSSHPGSWLSSGRATLILERGSTATDAYDVDVTPTAFVIDEGGVIVSGGPVATIDELQTLVDDTDGVRIAPGTEVTT